MTTGGTVITDETAFVSELETVLRAALDRPVHITSVSRRINPFTTLFPAEIVTVSTEDAGMLALFVKSITGEHADHPAKLPEREARVYEHLLRDPSPPAVRCYGVRWQESFRIGKLFLEYVDGWSLNYQPLEFWYQAAEALGRLHVHFAGRRDSLARADFLLRLDATYFLEWAERAAQVLDARNAQSAEALRKVLRNYRGVIDVLERHGCTLVHNDLSPKNVLADGTRDADNRIRIVDWELAGVGCGLLDLVQLKDGLDVEADRRMREIYCQAVAGTDLLPDDPAELDRLFAACDVHKTMYRLARSANWGLDDATITAWVTEVVRLVEHI